MAPPAVLFVFYKPIIFSGNQNVNRELGVLKYIIFWSMKKMCFFEKKVLTEQRRFGIINKRSFGRQRRKAKKRAWNLEKTI